MEERPQKSRSYRDLDVWKLALDLVKDIYLMTGTFPQAELYGLTSQIRRAAVSIPSNIAEGQSRNSFKEFKQFLSIALGSLAEIETQLIIANEIGYLASAEIDKFLVRVDTIRKMIKALTHSLK
ncbi:MAG: four helix bundle protein [Thermodesulfobacteriota bacterium]